MGNDCRHETKASKENHSDSSLPERAIYALDPDKRFLPPKVRKFIDLLHDRLNWGIVTFRIKNKQYNDLTLESDLFGIFLSICWLKSSQAEGLHTKKFHKSFGILFWYSKQLK